MLGAIIGDTVGSIYEFDNIKTTDFPLFSERSEFTDDSIMSVAVADWLYFQGLACPDAPVSAASLLRRFSVVITFVLGARFFHEANLVRKGLALAAIVVGVVLICLGKG